MNDTWWVPNNGSYNLNGNLTSRLETCDTSKSEEIYVTERDIQKWWQLQT